MYESSLQKLIRTFPALSVGKKCEEKFARFRLRLPRATQASFYELRRAQRRTDYATGQEEKYALLIFFLD